MRYMKIIAGFVVWLAVCQLPTLISMPFVQSNMAWYHTLAKPPLSPPDWVFGMVWGILYVLLGISAAIAFKDGINRTTKTAFWLFIVQLALNALWTPVYFGLHHFAGATIIVVLMLGEGFYLHRHVKRLNSLAATMMLPYWGWLIFATYLTIANWGLNG